jgi:hypothetical protein
MKILVAIHPHPTEIADTDLQSQTTSDGCQDTGKMPVPPSAVTVPCPCCVDRVDRGLGAAIFAESVGLQFKAIYNPHR